MFLEYWLMKKKVVSYYDKFDNLIVRDNAGSDSIALCLCWREFGYC